MRRFLLSLAVVCAGIVPAAPALASHPFEGGPPYPPCGGDGHNPPAGATVVQQQTPVDNTGQPAADVGTLMVAFAPGYVLVSMKPRYVEIDVTSQTVEYTASNTTYGAWISPARRCVMVAGVGGPLP